MSLRSFILLSIFAFVLAFDEPTEHPNATHVEEHAPAEAGQKAETSPPPLAPRYNGAGADSGEPSGGEPIPHDPVTEGGASSSSLSNFFILVTCNLLVTFLVKHFA
ncbi:uncharacterized protein LOC116181039 isoform X2 [Photinus pyralis]|uniref:uncharacterized protein LOC116181036 isoform X2 n=1 Tax=Photinus pyralis TaxID=7054 RepID=UPI0012675793|nr:uncharacterized protein LOC116181036 isoform X2 [Photinus pyralis]XP_031357127.1 uncharacterized protein LOC116181039 isoform X2 [Photinus pyralis]